jgi:hypothetical protein
MAAKDLLQKVVDTTAIGADGGGILSPKQANRFLDYVVDQSVLMKTARVVRMNEPTIDIDKVDIGQRIMRKATEGTDDGVNADPTFSKISMTTVKLRLDWEMTTEGLEDNIEGDSLEDHVASLMARQTANDLEDLYIHGDTALTGDPLLKSLNGFRKRARAGAHVVDAAGANLTRSTFDKALRALPNKYLQRRNQLVWSTSSSLVQDYIWSLTLDVSGTGAPAPGSVMGEAIVNGGMGAASGGGIGTSLVPGLRPFGIGLLEVPLYEETEDGTYSGADPADNHGVVELTFPQNRIIGIQREIVIYREFKPKKDAIEYTQFIRVTNQIENDDAFVHVRNVLVRS